MYHEGDIGRGMDKSIERGRAWRCLRVLEVRSPDICHIKNFKETHCERVDRNPGARCDQSKWVQADIYSNCLEGMGHESPKDPIQ
jgi:hypothetical protein